jgi:hypothetical protein
MTIIMFGGSYGTKGTFGSCPIAPSQFVGMTNFLAEESPAQETPEIWLKCTLHRTVQSGLTKKSEANQTAAVGYGLANILVRPALAQNQTYP